MHQIHPTRGSALRRAVRTTRRTILARRRLLATMLVAVATLGVLRTVAPPPPQTRLVSVAAHDLAAGTVLSSSDLRTVDLPAGLLVGHLVGDPVGRTLASPLRQGEPVTDVRVTGVGLATGYPGQVVLPVRFPDAAAVALLRPGMQIDVLAGGADQLVASNATVVTLPPEPAAAGQPTAGRLVVLAAAPADAAALARAQVDGFLTFLMTG
ncbi:MAG: SAF domain-containing protein [Nocardioides sp.]|uniref:SAF domain-containing protein n=1 Tax=Nocardioides sp. TaxID=35761 RepID=UPI0039E6B871